MLEDAEREEVRGRAPVCGEEKDEELIVVSRDVREEMRSCGATSVWC
jgi:hypothetical protein